MFAMMGGFYMVIGAVITFIGLILSGVINLSMRDYDETSRASRWILLSPVFFVGIAFLFYGAVAF